MDEGNAFIPEFIEDFNKRFGKEPTCDTDVHRPLFKVMKKTIWRIFFAGMRIVHFQTI